ncbi:DUF2071 domain-containing protein [Lentibacillus cibarius]|uniref:DUF2071 domain-containing protein n=2 Tax=Lentibacillus cibarius TaxID=2583219 RepID=A0A5S3QIF8_9BACI|nr:DUF2071 domain-containing protein [Lentibacillus cibarius]
MQLERQNHSSARHEHNSELCMCLALKHFPRWYSCVILIANWSFMTIPARRNRGGCTMKRPWIGVQYWENPIFMHWPVPYDVLRSLVPEPFQLDTFHGRAWVSIVLFRSPRSHLRWGSGLFSLSSLSQVNVRTYIRFYEEPAVYFLTVYTNSKLSVLGARWLLSLPYQHAYFDGGSRTSFRMKQTNGDSFGRFSAHVYPSSERFTPEKHTLAHWLTERYHFYTIKGKHIVKATISHMPWRLSEARYNIKQNNLLAITPETRDPLVHVASSQTTYLYPPQVRGCQALAQF